MEFPGVFPVGEQAARLFFYSWHRSKMRARWDFLSFFRPGPGKDPPVFLETASWIISGCQGSGPVPGFISMAKGEGTLIPGKSLRQAIQQSGVNTSAPRMSIV